MQFLKELRNCILCIIRMWSWVCSVQPYKSLFSTNHFIKLIFCLSMILCLVFLYLWFSVSVSLVFRVFAFCFEFNVIIPVVKSASIINHAPFNFVLIVLTHSRVSLYTKDLVKYKKHFIKNILFIKLVSYIKKNLKKKKKSFHKSKFTYENLKSTIYSNLILDLWH